MGGNAAFVCILNVILTMGSKGALLVNDSGSSFFPMKPANVVDVTGAGDSFWSGMLMAVRDGLSLSDAIRFGQMVAEIKLQQTGPLLQHIDRFTLYQGLNLVPPQESGA